MAHSAADVPRVSIDFCISNGLFFVCLPINLTYNISRAVNSVDLVVAVKLQHNYNEEYMGLISEIRRKTKMVSEPEIELTINDLESLSKGESVTKKDKLGDEFIVILESDPKPAHEITIDDLGIEKLPKAARPLEV